MSVPLVSFVVPCYNYGRYLRDCIDRIFAQEGEYEMEIIAINDCSTDDTLAILRSYDDSRLHIIDHEVNRGHIFTINEGIERTNGKYVVRIDPDDRHRPQFLSRLVPILESKPEIALAYGNVALIDGEGRIGMERADTHHRGHDYMGNEFVALLKKNFICAPTVIARREAWMSACPVPEGLAFNDWYFNIMLARRWPFYYCDEVLADYRVHDSNHHSKISQDGSEERSVIKLLDLVYSQEETDSALEQAKLSAKAEAYASHYLDFAIKYFGHGMNAESRRCFLRVLFLGPSLMAKPTHLRLMLATFFPRRWYDAAKNIWRMPA